MKLITTSWDDGHILDFKIAELLTKYNLQGTFYIPRQNDERPVMNETQLLAIAKDFEIGGHTLNHVRLYTKNKAVWDHEIRGSYLWLQQLLGYNPVSFCFPGGHYSSQALGS
ncbi:MAG TPA: polysaccharide deacetylase family protein, partial [Segetibacter sp.]